MTNLQRLSDISRIVLHHSASPRDTTTVEAIRGWHKDRGFSDVGYHFVIEGDGALRHGRQLDVIPAAQKGANTGTIAICIVGDNTKPGEGWNESQRISAHSLIVMLRTVFGQRLPFCGHRDVAPSECPGLEVRDVFPELL
jgi:hypothetical protein